MEVVIAGTTVASSSAGYPVRGFAGSSSSNVQIESLLRTPHKSVFDRGNLSVDFSFGVDREFSTCDEATAFYLTELLRVTGKKVVKLQMGATEYQFMAAVSLAWEPNVGRTARLRYSVRGIYTGTDTTEDAPLGGGEATRLEATDGEDLQTTTGAKLHASA